MLPDDDEEIDPDVAALLREKVVRVNLGTLLTLFGDWTVAVM